MGQGTRERTRHLIELGGLVLKADLAELLDNDRATLLGALLLDVAGQLRVQAKVTLTPRTSAPAGDGPGCAPSRRIRTLPRPRWARGKKGNRE